MNTAHPRPLDRSRRWAETMIAHHYRGSREVHRSPTMRAVLDGVYDGDVTIAEVLRRGDFGLGTFNHLDGGRVILDGRHELVTTNLSRRILD